MWRQQWTATAAEQRPDTATAALSSCSSIKFPNVYRLLSILGMLPVTTCESERIFSKLQRTLTSIRCTITEDRLEVLLLLQCQGEHCPTPDDILSAFAKKARRLNFVLWPKLLKLYCSVDISFAFCHLSCIHFIYIYSALRCKAEL